MFRKRNKLFLFRLFFGWMHRILRSVCGGYISLLLIRKTLERDIPKTQRLKST